MINLLPLAEKKALIKEMNTKLMLVLGFLFLISFICFVLILLALYFYILVQTSYQQSLLDDAKKQYQTAEFLQYKDLMAQYNGMLTKTDSFYRKESYFFNALAIISGIKKPENVHISNLAIERTKNSTLKVSISGTSDTRENLSLFKTNIEAEKNIDTLYFPPDNWLKPVDVHFYLTFEIHEKSK